VAIENSTAPAILNHSTRQDQLSATVAAHLMFDIQSIPHAFITTQLKPDERAARRSRLACFSSAREACETFFVLLSKDNFTLFWPHLSNLKSLKNLRKIGHLTCFFKFPCQAF